jgi:DNA-binding response OmpR family regulator
MRILLVEDDSRVASFIRRGLREEHYTVDVSKDGEEALFLAQTGEYDLLILERCRC